MIFKWLLTCSIGMITFISSHAWCANDFLHGTVFQKVGKEQQIDPLLLYAITLVESGSGTGNGFMAPTPLVIRSAKGAEFFTDAESATKRLNTLLESTNQIDVGMVQRNLKWHPTSEPERMFDAEYSLVWAANLLKETIASSPDLALGIGRYHNWEDSVRARSYGKRVLKIYQNLKDYKQNNLSD